MARFPRRSGRLVKNTVQKWIEDGVVHWGASLSYYSLISLAPLLLILVTLLGAALGPPRAQAEVLRNLEVVLGRSGSQLAAEVLERTPGLSIVSWRSAATLLVLLLGSTAVFANLRGALNAIWGVPPRSGRIRQALRGRGLAFLMILATGTMMVLSLVIGTAASLLAPHVATVAPRAALLIPLFDWLISVSFMWLFVCAAYAILPDVRLGWRDVWVGGLVTAVLIGLGKSLMGAYMLGADFATSFGAAGSIMVFLIWVYYSAQMLLLGAEFTVVRSRDLAVGSTGPGEDLRTV